MDIQIVVNVKMFENKIQYDLSYRTIKYSNQMKMHLQVSVISQREYPTTKISIIRLKSSRNLEKTSNFNEI